MKQLTTNETSRFLIFWENLVTLFKCDNYYMYNAYDQRSKKLDKVTSKIKITMKSLRYVFLVIIIFEIWNST